MNCLLLYIIDDLGIPCYQPCSHLTRSIFFFTLRSLSFYNIKLSCLVAVLIYVCFINNFYFFSDSQLWNSLTLSSIFLRKRGFRFRGSYVLSIYFWLKISILPLILLYFSPLKASSDCTVLDLYFPLLPISC